MIALVLAMLWTRRGQAVTLALLALFAVAAAVAAPAYLAASEQAVAAGQVSTALPGEVGFQVSAVQDETGQLDGTGGPEISFADVGAALVDLPGFTYVYAAEFPAIGIEDTAAHRSRMVYRQDACAHLTLVRGRCVVAEGDVVIGEEASERMSLAPGDPITLTFAQFSQNPQTPVFEPKGLPKALTVVGVYRVRDAADAYWGAHGYFAADPGDRAGEPVFATAGTLEVMDHGATGLSIDARADRGMLRTADPATLRAELAELSAQANGLGPSVQVRTGIPGLLDRIADGRAAARVIVPVVAVPLVLLACLSIYLAVGYSTEGRRPELAVVKLRGSKWWARWWLATGESLIAIVAGAVAGCLAGQLLVNALAAARFPDADVAASFASLRYAPIAAAAAVLAAVLAQRRQLLSPVVDLLRRAVVAVPSGARAFAVEGTVVLLAAVTGVQLFVSGGELTGVGLFTTALVALALALLAARVALRVIARLAARALRRGRLGSALAGFQLARRPGAARLVALLVATVAITGYAASAVDVAAEGRAVASGLGNGADRVLDVQQVSRGQLLAAVRAIDPDGDFAMAVTTLPGGGREAPPALAVDSTRLEAVANWPADAPPVDKVAEALRPEQVSQPVRIPGRDLTLDVTTSGDVRQALRLNVAVSSLTGLGDGTVQLGGLRDGRYTYQQRVEVCRDGCRLKGIQLATPPGVTTVSGRVTITGLRVVNPAQPVLTATELSDLGQWRVSDATASAAPDGLRLDIDAPGGLPEGAWVQHADTPDPLPVAVAGQSGVDEVTGFDNRPVRVRAVATLPAVPRIGSTATLVDLDYLDRRSVDTGQAVQPQVWLSARAPADVERRLTERGVPVIGDVTVAQLDRQLDEQGPALALWFYVLAGVLAVTLAAGALLLAAVVDRPRRVEDLSALRAQGLGRRAVSRATLWTYPLLVLASVLTGLVIAAVLWALTGWALPLAGLDPPDLPLPNWPRAPILLVAGAIQLVVLAGVAYAAGGRTHREIS